jgi:hypothetical protein
VVKQLGASDGRQVVVAERAHVSILEERHARRELRLLDRIRVVRELGRQVLDEHELGGKREPRAVAMHLWSVMANVSSIPTRPLGTKDAVKEERGEIIKTHQHDLLD